MTINSSAVAHDTYDVMGTTIGEFYENVDRAVLPSDVQPGKYRTVILPSYQSQCPVNTGAYTTIDLGTNDPQVIMLDRSFIRLVIDGTLTCDQDISPGSDVLKNSVQYFAGFGRSIESCSRYQILHNGKVVVDQAYVGEESFIISNCIKNSVMKRRPGEYTTYESAHEDKEYKCGVKLNLIVSGEGDTIPAKTAIPFQMKLKIHLDDIPFFRNWSILPGWYGNWQIRLWPDPQNIKMCVVNPSVSYPDVVANGASAYSHDFHQLGETFSGITIQSTEEDEDDNVITSWSTQDVTWSCSTYTLSQCEYVATSEIQYDTDYEANRNKYRGKPLSLPYQHFDLVRFSGAVNVTGGGHSHVLTGMVKCAECLYILPFTKNCQHTICRNPCFQGFQLTIGPFGPYPNNTVDTVEYTEASGLSDTYVNFLNMTLDSLNLDNSMITTANPDVLNSLHNDIKVQYVAVYNDDTKTFESGFASTSNDWCNSNFFIGIPFADDEQFQGGLTTQSNINIKMVYSGSTYENAIEQGPTAVFCCDYVLMISPNEFGQATISNVQDKMY